MLKIIKNTILLTVCLLALVFVYSINAYAQDENTNQVVSVKMLVKRGDLISPSNLTLVDYRAKKIPDDMITDIKDAENLQALRTLRPGMQLRYTYLREMPLVAKDKFAKAVYSVPGIKLESEVEMLQDGQLGDVVKARNIKSGSTITAQVIGRNLIQVK